MPVLEACLETGAAYLDTAIHEEPDEVCEDPPWYANHEWKRADALRRPRRHGDPRRRVRSRRRQRLLPRWPPGSCFDTIDTIDILDVNAGSHGRYFATNFDPEINFREFVKVLDVDRPAVGRVPDAHRAARVRLPGRRPPARLPHRPRRAALAVREHRRQQHPLLDGLRRPLHQRVHRRCARSACCRTSRCTVGDQEVVPLHVVKAVLPDPQTLAPGYTGKTCIGEHRHRHA